MLRMKLLSLGILKKKFFVCSHLIATLKKNPYFCAINKNHNIIIV